MSARLLVSDDVVGLKATAVYLEVIRRSRHAFSEPDVDAELAELAERVLRLAVRMDAEDFWIANTFPRSTP